jgi:hypothetical protein
MVTPVLVHKALRYRVYPTAAQETQLLAWESSLRFLWNLAHEQRLQGVHRHHVLTILVGVSPCRVRFVRHHAHAVEVRAVVELLDAACFLWRHVLGCTDDHAVARGLWGTRVAAGSMPRATPKSRILGRCQ